VLKHFDGYVADDSAPGPDGPRRGARTAYLEQACAYKTSCPESQYAPWAAPCQFGRRPNVISEPWPPDPRPKRFEGPRPT